MQHKASLQSSHFMLVFMPSPLPPWLLLHLQRKQSTLLWIQSGEGIPGTFQQRGRGVCLVTSLVGSGGKADCVLHVSLSIVWSLSIIWSPSIVWSLVWECRLVWEYAYGPGLCVSCQAEHTHTHMVDCTYMFFVSLLDRSISTLSTLYGGSLPSDFLWSRNAGGELFIVDGLPACRRSCTVEGQKSKCSTVHS